MVLHAGLSPTALVLAVTGEMREAVGDVNERQAVRRGGGAVTQHGVVGAHE